MRTRMQTYIRKKGLTKHLFVFYDGFNKYEHIFEKGLLIMNWMRKNSFFSMLIIFGLLFTGFLYITDEDITKYEQITISHGESLWSLADHYRGKMSKQDWIHTVEQTNNISKGNIMAGAVLSVPVEENSQYIIVQKQQLEAIKVASDQ